MPEDKKHRAGDPLRSLYWRDEILQVMYWMAGEGFGHEVDVPDLRKFLAAEDSVLRENLDLMLADGLIEQVGQKFSLTPSGQNEGGRRFADGFEEMIKPGHFECDEPDCDCHNPDSIEVICKHLSPPM